MQTSHPQWVVLEAIAGELQAELLRGLLEAQGIPVQLSQEGAGRAIGLSVGPLGEVDVLVPSDRLAEAQQVMADYYAGRFENSLEEQPGGEEEDQG